MIIQVEKSNVGFSFVSEGEMSKLQERYPTIKRVQLPSEGMEGTENLDELIRPYLDWHIGEIENGRALLLYKSPEGTPADYLHERLVLLLGEVAAAWLKYRYDASAR
jgi:hypothetical protein